MKLILIIMLLSLASCGFLTKNTDSIITEKTVRVDSRALEPCPQLETLITGATFEDLQRVVILNTELYYICKEKQANSIVLIKEFANIKEEKK
jgi:hypothetical protein